MNESQRTILIVDDEEDLRDALCFDFRRQGYNVLLAENGRVAYQMIKSNPVALVLSDVRMAGGDGVELLKNLKDTHPQIPLILSTGFAEIGIDEAYALGASAVLLKPFERKILKETVQKTLTPFNERVVAQNENSSTVDSEIVLDDKKNEEQIAFGSMGVSFWWDAGKIKDKMNLKIHYKSEKFQEVLLYATVRYVSGTSAELKKQRIGAEIYFVQGEDNTKFANWIYQSNLIASIPR